MEIELLKTASGALMPMDSENEAFKKLKTGSVIRCEVTEMRNGKFFRKWWALVKLAFDIWTETVPNQEYKGIEVTPNFNRFRKDVTILSGYYDPVFNVKGDLRMEPKSLKWSQMSEQDFNVLYEATLTTILNKIIPHKKMTEQQLRDWAEKVMHFA